MFSQRNRYIAFFLVIFLASCGKRNFTEEAMSAIRDGKNEKALEIIDKTASFSEDDLKRLARKAIENKLPCRMLESLCGKGLSPETAFKKESEEFSLASYAIECEDFEFFKSLIDIGLDPFSKCLKDNHLAFNSLEYCIYKDKLDFYAYALREIKNIEKKDLASTIAALFYFAKSDSYIDGFMAIPGVLDNLKKEKKLVPFIAENFDEQKIKAFTKYLDLDSLDFSNSSECLRCAIMSADLNCVKWVLKNGVQADTPISFSNNEYSTSDFCDYLCHRLHFEGEAENLERGSRIKEIKDYLNNIK